MLLSANLTSFQISPPPFLSLVNSQSSMDEQFPKGVSFASGGSGLLDETGKYSVRPLSSEHLPSLAFQSLSNLRTRKSLVHYPYKN